MTKSYGQSWYGVNGYSGKTEKWSSSDTEALFNENMTNPEKRAALEHFGWTRDNISYKFNADGFRSEEFTYEPNDSVLFLGCSLTMGVGLDLESTWTYKVASSLGLRRYNLGVGGGSPDMCFRLAYHWIPLLRPKYVVMLTPNSVRMEIVMDRSIRMYLPTSRPIDEFYVNWLSHPANADMHKLKCVMGVQTICNNIGVPLIEIPIEDKKFLLKEYSWARDLTHFGSTWNHKASNIFLQKISEISN